MARGNDRKGKQERRARDEIEKGLSRGDVALSVEAFGELSAGDRRAFEARVGALLRPAVAAAHEARAWATLSHLAARAERAPAIVEAGASGVEAGDAWWALLWGCVRQQDRARAGRIAARLAPALGDSPALAAALAAGLEGLDGGALDAQLVAALPPGLLGTNDAAPEPLRAAPRGDRVEGAVLALCGSRPWAVAADVIERWGRQLPPGEGAAALTLAGRLAAREVLARISARKPLPEESLPLLLVAARALPGAPALEAPLAVALRVLLVEASAAEPRRGLVAELPAVAAALAAYPGQRAAVASALETLPLDGLDAFDALQLHERLLPASRSAALWVQAAACWTRAELASGERRSPSLAALRAALARIEPAAFSPGLLRSLPPGSLVDGLALLGRIGTLDAIERVFEGCFPMANAPVVAGLSAMVGGLMGRAGSVIAAKMQAQLGGAMEGGVERMINRLAAEHDDESDDAERLLRRLAPRATRGNEALFEVLLATERDPDELARLLEGYLEGAEGFAPWLSALRGLAAAEQDALVRSVLARALARLGGDVDALSAALLSLVQERMPVDVAEAVAGALLDAAERAPIAAAQPAPAPPAGPLPAPSTRSMAISFAHRLLPSRPERAAPPAAAPAESPPQPEAGEPGTQALLVQAEERDPHADQPGVQPVAPGNTKRTRRPREKQIEQLSLLLADPTPPPPRSLATEAGEDAGVSGSVEAGESGEAGEAGEGTR
jgi:hypothetical protein